MRFSFLAFLFLLFHSTLATAFDTDLERASLRGISRVNLLVEPLPSDAHSRGLTERLLTTDTELALRMAGIQLSSDCPTPLYLLVSIYRPLPDLDFYVYSIALSIHQQVYLERDPTISTLAATWEAIAYIGNSGGDHVVDAVRSQTKDRVAQFVNAYLSVNPRK